MPPKQVRAVSGFNVANNLESAKKKRSRNDGLERDWNWEKPGVEALDCATTAATTATTATASGTGNKDASDSGASLSSKKGDDNAGILTSSSSSAIIASANSSITSYDMFVIFDVSNFLGGFYDESNNKAHFDSKKFFQSIPYISEESFGIYHSLRVACGSVPFPKEGEKEKGKENENEKADWEHWLFNDEVVKITGPWKVRKEFRYKKEMMVDDCIIANVYDTVISNMNHTNAVIVLVTGDGNSGDASNLSICNCVMRVLMHFPNWSVHLYTWRKSCSPLYKRLNDQYSKDSIAGNSRALPRFLLKYIDDMDVLRSIVSPTLTDDEDSRPKKRNRSELALKSGQNRLLSNEASKSVGKSVTSQFSNIVVPVDKDIAERKSLESEETSSNGPKNSLISSSNGANKKNSVRMKLPISQQVGGKSTNSTRSNSVGNIDKSPLVNRQLLMLSSPSANHSRDICPEVDLSWSTSNIKDKSPKAGTSTGTAISFDEPRNIVNVFAVDKTINDKWSCSVCTFMNNARIKICDACNIGNKPGVTPIKRSTNYYVNTGSDSHFASQNSDSYNNSSSSSSCSSNTTYRENREITCTYCGEKIQGATYDHNKICKAQSNGTGKGGGGAGGGRGRGTSRSGSGGR